MEKMSMQNASSAIFNPGRSPDRARASADIRRLPLSRCPSENKPTPPFVKVDEKVGRAKLPPSPGKALANMPEI
jgi:hypothetical protein